MTTNWRCAFHPATTVEPSMKNNVGNFSAASELYAMKEGRAGVSVGEEAGSDDKLAMRLSFCDYG